MNRELKQRVVCKVLLRPEHIPIGRTRHSVNGRPLDPPKELHVVQFDEDSGFYLIHNDEDGQEMTDTYHTTQAEAMAQAQFEFGIQEEDWT